MALIHTPGYTPIIKICGMMRPADVEACAASGANWVGFVAVPSSRHFLSPEKMMALADHAKGKLKRVGLFVDASDDEIKTYGHGLDLVQLHGSETPSRVAHIKNMCQRPVIKALPVVDRTSLEDARMYETCADYLLFDAAPKNGQRGGNGEVFNWDILREAELTLPWLLAGGLNPENVTEGIKQLLPWGVDVSSGVETNGAKDPQKIVAFCQSVRSAGSAIQ